MAAKKKQNVLSGLVRDTFRKTKVAAGRAAKGGDGSKSGILNVLEYIEQPWGLHMDGKNNRAMLFPAQRFIVKLFYNLELDTKLSEDPRKRIQVMDMLGTKVLHEFSEAQYLQYLYDNGRCNIGQQDHDRRELILAVGRRAGKCVRGDTLVPTNAGFFRIEDLAEAPEEGFSPLEVGVAQEAGRRASSAFFYNGGVKPTFGVRSKCGYEITGTGNHRVKVLAESGKIEWRFLDEIRPGEYLAVNRSADLWATDQLHVAAYHNDAGRKDLSFPDRLDERWGRLLGYLVGDGSWGNAQSVALTVEHPETWDQMTALFDELFGSHRVQIDKRTKGTGRLEFPSVGMRRFLHSLGWSMDCGRYDKMVPWAILQSPKPVVCAFLRGLFETDGSAEGGGRHITFSSASFRLAREVQLLLLNLGIVTNISKKWNRKTKRHYANLNIKGVRSRRLFAQWIGFDSEKKQRPLLTALEVAKEGKSNTESVPHQYRHIRALLESTPRHFGGNGAKGWKRSHLREAFGNACKPNSGENLTYTRMKAARKLAVELGAGEEEIRHFDELLQADYFFDPVVSVEEGEDQVYDLNVPEGHMFVANGLTNHNTTMSGIFASYEVYRLLNLYNPQEYYGLPNGNRIQIISVATDKDQASLLFNEVSTHINKCDYFKPYLGSNTLSRIDFRTPYDIEQYGTSHRNNDGKFTSLSGKTTLRVTFKGSTAKGLRGAGNIIIILDEVAHFQDKGTMSAEEIYNAVSPSAAAFSRKDPVTGRPAEHPVTGEADVESRIILISSPLGRSGLFYQKFEQAMQGGEGANNLLAIQAPTWEINPTVPSKYYKEKYHENPQVFMVEHGAQFSDQSRGWIERLEDLTVCIDEGRRPLMRARPKMPHQMGIDVGLVDDGTSISITHIEDGNIVLDYHEIWYAGVSWREANPHLNGEFSTPYAKMLQDVDRLDFDEIAKWILALTKRFYVTEGLFDSWNGIPLEQKLHKMGLKQFHSEFFTRDATSKMYQSAKMMIFDERIRIYDYPIPERAKEGEERHSPFVAELLSLQANQVSKHITLVEAPKKPGAHDDQADAFIRSVWLSMQQLNNEKHVYKGHGVGRPRAATSMTPARYQHMKARRNGGGGPKTRNVRSTRSNRRFVKSRY